MNKLIIHEIMQDSDIWFDLLYCARKKGNESAFLYTLKNRMRPNPRKSTIQRVAHLYKLARPLDDRDIHEIEVWLASDADTQVSTR